MSLRSFSDSRTLLRSGPAITRSIDSSSAAMVIFVPLARAVSRAASLITLARSAPVKPAVRRAIMSSSTPSANGLPRACTRRMPLRPARPGCATTIWRSDPAGAQQRRVEDVGPVGRRDDDDAALDVEPVQLDKQLVKRLLTLVVPAAEPGATVPADRVDLVHEHDRGSVRLGLLEQVPHPG